MEQLRPLAFLLGACLPGQGLLYMGWVSAARALLVAWAASLVLMPVLGLPAMALVLLITLAGALASLLVPRRARPAFGALRRAAWTRVFTVLWAWGVSQGLLGGCYTIPAGSMIPTLQVGDHVQVSKLAYGLQLWPSDVRIGRRVPARGDVIVFTLPRDPKKDFVKRVIGVPGDTIEVKDNVAIVNGKPLRTSRPGRDCGYDDYMEAQDRWTHEDARCYEELVGDHRYTVAVSPRDFARDFPIAGDASPYVVPPDSVFVLGDNRNNSHDSRYWGPVPLANVKGRAEVVYWSSGKDGVRGERIGRAVE